MILQSVLVNDETTLHLQVDTDPTTSPKYIGSLKRRFLWTGFGLVCVSMLIGAAALAIHSLASPADSPSGSRKSSHHVSEVAFAFVPTGAFRAAGLRPSIARVSQGHAVSRTPPFRMTTVDDQNLKFTVPDPRMSNELYLSKFTVKGLQIMLKERGLPVSGKKAELVSRLGPLMGLLTNRLEELEKDHILDLMKEAEVQKTEAAAADASVTDIDPATKAPGRGRLEAEYLQGVEKIKKMEAGAVAAAPAEVAADTAAAEVKATRMASRRGRLQASEVKVDSAAAEVVAEMDRAAAEIEATTIEKANADRLHEIGSFWEGSQSRKRLAALSPFPPPSDFFAAVSGGGHLYIVHAGGETGEWCFDEADVLKSIGRASSLTALGGTRGVDLLKHLYELGPATRALMWKLPVHDVELMQNAIDGSALEKMPSVNFTLQAAAHLQLDNALAWALKTHRTWATLHGSPDATATYQLAQSSQPAVALMEAVGLPFDSHGAGLLVQKWQKELVSEEVTMQKLVSSALANKTLNVKSSAQVGEVIARLLPAEELATWPRTPKGALRTDAATMLRSSLPFVQQLARCRELNHALSHYSSYAATAEAGGGRLFPVYHLSGAVTGRMSCAEPNVQSMPRSPEFRALVAAPKGGWLVKGDFSQVELRVLAEISGDTRMKNAFARGEDLHTLTAAELLDVAVEKVSAAQRQLAKAINFGLIYGMGARGLQQYAEGSYGVVISHAEAQLARQRFFEAYPGVAAWQDAMRGQVARGEQIVTPAGRVAWHLIESNAAKDYSKSAHWTSRLEREAMNFPIQGGAAEVMLATLAGLKVTLESAEIAATKDPKAACWLIAVVHDEFILECASKRSADIAAQALSLAMQAAWLQVFPAAAPLGQAGASISIGHDWSELK